MYPIAFASVLSIRRQLSVFVTWQRALKVLLPTCRKTVMDPSAFTALPPNTLIFTVGGSRASHSFLQSFFAWLTPIMLHPVTVSTSQSICSITESFALDIHAGQMCSEFLPLVGRFQLCPFVASLLKLVACLLLFLIWRMGVGKADGLLCF